MIEALLQLDKELFLLLNGWHLPIIDPVMVFFSGKFTWVPFYLFLLGLIVYRFGWESIRILLMIAVLISLADQISVHWFKFPFERLRPCHEPELEGLIHLVTGNCGGRFGFVSSHAANSFALAGFVSLLLSPFYRWMSALIFTWAFLVSYSRIYLGVHYPGDIIGGAMLGWLISLLVWKLYHLSFKYFCGNKC